MVRVAHALVFTGFLLVVHMIVAPAIVDPLVEVFMGFSYMSEHADLYDMIQTVLYLWVPVALMGVMVIISVIWYLRRRSFTGATRR